MIELLILLSSVFSCRFMLEFSFFFHRLVVSSRPPTEPQPTMTATTTTMIRMLAMHTNLAHSAVVNNVRNSEIELLSIGLCVCVCVLHVIVK